MEDCRNISNEPNNINLLTRQTTQMSIFYPKDLTGVGVIIAQVYKWMKVIALQ